MFLLKLVTYQGLYEQYNATSINIPTIDGRRGILTNHMPIIAPLVIGIMNVKDENGRDRKYTISNGVCNFQNNVAEIIVDTIEDVEKIDVERAKRAKQRAEDKLAVATERVEIVHAQATLAKALNRLNAVKKN